ncbi:T9SS type A sorting domain-containing protein [Hyunsoonleella pacifica]|uniref:T9SS type A sorting domain-containing protein n=1 Tax=Hyunsoonleella pacifica TaxID=1080224 RepID=A0A4Q9FKC6_9FLAO|nr:T9SS type A sorting domain-containing protein [Hyunsoonleella pacifica]TBN13065.1 T9SS type A sorting domain-containing protein [Hyunsoonleella pacifica]GGD27425.1 hypothetical protein GCM10011368_31820 [Hyunsoonleella pacifica]
MKTKLLLLLLCVSFLGYSQTYDHTTYFISEIIPSPPNSSTAFFNDSDNAAMEPYQTDTDAGIEYFEFRGPANGTIPANTYFIAIDGDGDDSDVGTNIGKVREAVDLSGLQFGSNGILVIVVDITMNTGTGAVDLLGADISGTKFINPYATDLAASDANVVTIQLVADTIEWTDESPSDGTNETLNNYNVSSITPDIGYDGTFNDQSSTYMIVQSATNPKDAIVDSNEDGVLDGDALTWTIYDSVSILDDDDITTGNGEVGEFGYGKIIFVEQLLSTDPLLRFDSSLSPTIVTLNQYPNYVARQGTSSGFDCTTDAVNNDDWMAGRVNSVSYPDWRFSGTGTRNVPSAELTNNNFSDFSGLTYGEVNVNFAPLSVDENVVSNFRIYPNPANNFITIESNNLQISSVSLYNILGKRILSENRLKDNRLNISNVAAGMYLMKINAEDRTLTKKIVIK